MNRKSKRKINKVSNRKRLSWMVVFFALIPLVLTVSLLTSNRFQSNPKSISNSSSRQVTKSLTKKLYQVSKEEKDYLSKRFANLTAVNGETIAYIYAPGTKLDEPIVQTSDNSTYLEKTFEGGYEPYMGTVFMDKDNKKDFSDRLTWLFGHARGSQVADNRMFNDVNFYDNQEFFDQHKYLVIETPERKFYYEAMGLVIVPEETAFYRTTFDGDKDFTDQLTSIYEASRTKNKNITVKASDKYLVLSTCREEDETIRSNLYLRQIPDSELNDFLEKHTSELSYAPTR